MDIKLALLMSLGLIPGCWTTSVVRAVGTLSAPGDDNLSKARCPQGTVVVSCTCSDPPCDGTEVKKDNIGHCLAWSSKDGPGQQAIALCVPGSSTDFKAVKGVWAKNPPSLSCGTGYTVIHCMIRNPSEPKSHSHAVMKPDSESCDVSERCDAGSGCMNVAICMKN